MTAINLSVWQETGFLNHTTIQSDHLLIADWMIPPLRREHSHGKTHYIPWKQVLVRSWLWKIYTLWAPWSEVGHESFWDSFFLPGIAVWSCLIQDQALCRTLSQKGREASYQNLLNSRKERSTFADVCLSQLTYLLVGSVRRSMLIPNLQIAIGEQ